MIRFLLNREIRVEERLDPNLTVLDYLRRHLGKTGTKEGCASGDCGACTVVVGELVTGEDGAERIRYRSLNSCLTFVSALHGKQLITVEDLKHQDRLHDVQQAMVDCHGSQCGFCTPGFVMSLFALQKNSAGADPAKAHEALAGNLCRCTGYRPILDAAEQACCHKRADQFDAREAATIEQLRAIAPRETAELNSGDRRCLLPLTVADLADLYGANPQARLLAGGTDLALEVTQFHRELPVMIYVGHIREMKRIEVGANCLEIGAATPLTDCYQALAADYPDFGELLQRFASLQIRNQGTLGGNIGNASPIGDAPPLLIALGAKIVLRRGERRRELPLEEYFLDYKVTPAKKASSSRRSWSRVPGPARRSRPTRSPSASTTIFPRSAPPSASTWKMAGSPAPGSPSAAWRRFPSAPPPAKRRCKARAWKPPASNAPRPPWRTTSPRSATSARARNIAC